MMKKLLFTMMTLGCTFFGFSQTLYVPGGTGGISSSYNAGNVGIATGPWAGATLHVEGDGIRGKRFSLGLINDLINDAPSYGLGFSNIQLSGSTGNAVQVSGYYGLLFKTASGTIVMDASGNVGIGTTTPGSYKLAVEGKIGAREVKVTLDSWSDFVFKKDYKLRGLNEVEQFIKENNHLPEIPSEKEVLENGVELGAMQAKLLQKIEELTLYTIEQQKRIEELEKQVSK